MGSKQAAPKQTDGQAPAIDSKLVERLARRMRDSLLPGDDPMDKDRLHEAARFVLEAGAAREMNRSAIALESLSEERRFMRIAIVNDDMPFLVDSTANAISALGIAIDRLVRSEAGCQDLARFSESLAPGLGSTRTRRALHGRGRGVDPPGGREALDHRLHEAPDLLLDLRR